MTHRRRLPQRRIAITHKFQHPRKTANRGAQFLLSYSVFPDGTPAELFINTEMRSGDVADVNISDAAIVVSLALQYGCPLDILRHAVRRNPDGTAQGPLGEALDVIAKDMNHEKTDRPTDVG